MDSRKRGPNNSDNFMYSPNVQANDYGDYAEAEPPRKRVALPPVVARKSNAAHMPRVMEMKNAARCRNPTCKTGKSRVLCTTCNVFLCIRDCFEDFHR